MSLGRKTGKCLSLRRFSLPGVRRADFWERLDIVLGPAYARSWAHDTVLTNLGLTVEQAFEGGHDTRDVWRAVCATIEVPSTLT
jgi:hypothetical protein